MQGDATQMLDHEVLPSPLAVANHSTSWTPVDSMTPVTTNPSQKRSRDETALESIEAENSYFPVAAQLHPPEPIPEEPVYGEGMALLNPTTGRALAAESQTGTWYEEKAAEEELQRTAQAEAQATRPTLPPISRKSARLSQSSIRAALEPLGLNMNGSAPASPPKSSSSPHTEIDEATIALGIGWTKVSTDDPDIQAAVRGWARYLDLHYSSHIHNAEILLKNKSLDTYLVACQEGFFLFQEDLLRGQLVGRTWETTLNNLRCQPPVFEGQEVLQAERTPGPESELAKKKMVNNWSDWNRINGGDSAQLPMTTNESNSGMDID